MIACPFLGSWSSKTFTLQTYSNRVERDRNITVKYQDEDGNEKEMKQLDIATSELLQHEIGKKLIPN